MCEITTFSDDHLPLLEPSTISRVHDAQVIHYDPVFSASNLLSTTLALDQALLSSTF
jgi:hypothetical protein